MTNKLYIELDCTDDDCVYKSGPKEGWLNVNKLTKQVVRDAKKHGVSAKLVNPNGPGGGCPVYAFTGTREELTSYMKAYHNPGLRGAELTQDINDMLDEYSEPATEDA